MIIKCVKIKCKNVSPIFYQVASIIGSVTYASGEIFGLMLRDSVKLLDGWCKIDDGDQEGEK